MKNKKFVSVILGGTFDPPHIGHLHISNLIIKKFNFPNEIKLGMRLHTPVKKIENSCKVREINR